MPPLDWNERPRLTLRRLEGLGHRVEPVTLDGDVSWDAYAASTGQYWIAHNAAFMRFLSATTGGPLDLESLEPGLADGQEKRPFDVEA